MCVVISTVTLHWWVCVCRCDSVEMCENVINACVTGVKYVLSLAHLYSLMSVWRCDSVEMLWLTLVWSVNTVTLRWWLCGCYSVEMLCFILVWLVVCVCVFDCDSTLLAVDCCCALLSIWPLFSNLQGGSFCCHQTDETIIRERGWGEITCLVGWGKKTTGMQLPQDFQLSTTYG